MMKLKVLAALVLVLMLSSCIHTAKFVSPEAKPRRIAILPTINNSTDVNGAIVLRNLSYTQFVNCRTYEWIPIDEIDEKLNEAGITDGGQLNSIRKSELSQILNADGLMYIEVKEMTYGTYGISSTRLVDANYKLYKMSSLYWEDEHKVDNGKSALGSIFNVALDPMGTLKESAKDLGKQVLVKGVKMWLLDHELKPEMNQVISRCYATLPK